MVNTSATKYNTTEISANSFSDLLRLGNQYMNGGLAYGLVFIIWLISMTVFSNYPNVDALKASTYTAWLSSVLFAVFGVIGPEFPLILFIVVAALAAYQQRQP
jgi:hypothetical protein